MTARNAGVEDGRRMQFLIGINIGDVTHDETRPYGDGVNVAARLEAVAEPGGICIAGSAYEQVRNKLALEVGDLGLHRTSPRSPRATHRRRNPPPRGG